MRPYTEIAAAGERTREMKTRVAATRSLLMAGLLVGACSDADDTANANGDGETASTEPAPMSSSADSQDPPAESDDDAGNDDDQSDDDDGNDPPPDDDDGGSSSGADDESSSGGDAPEPITPSPVGCVTSVEPGEHDFMCDGLAATVTVPEVCVTQACGVILDIHGASMTAQQEDNNTNMRALGLEHGYIIVQPTTDGFSWSAGHEARIMTGLYDVMDAFKADADRIHVMGFSAGGGVTWVILCAYPEVFASAVPAAATGQYFGAAPVCFGSAPPATELDILYMNGETDPFESMDYVGQLVGKIVTDWGFADPEMVEGDATYSRVRRTNSNGTKFELVTHSYESDEVIFVPPLVNQAINGHCYPGSSDHTASEPGQVTGYGCKGATSFHFGEMAMGFFEDNPR